MKLRKPFLLLAAISMLLAGCGTNASSSSSTSSAPESSSVTPSSSSGTPSSSSAHEHVLSEDYYANSSEHWKVCTICGEHFEEADHSFGEWEVIVEPTGTETGEKERECSVCGYIDSEVIPKKIAKTIALYLDNKTGASLDKNMITGFIGEDITADVAVNPGYVFKGWYDGETVVSDKQSYTFLLEEESPDLEARVVIGEASYTVEYWLQDPDDSSKYSHDPDEDIKLKGNTGDYTKATAKTIEGFVSQTFEQESIAGDGSTTIKIYYNRNTYHLTIANDNPTYGSIIEPSFFGGTYPHGREVATFKAQPYSGYTFTGWYDENNELISANASYKYIMPMHDAKITAKFAVKTDVEYIVKHLKQNTTDDGYTEVVGDRQILTGTTGATTVAEAKVYEGYHNLDIQQKIISGDGSTFVNVYYNRNSSVLTLTTNPNANTTINQTLVDGKVSLGYDTDVVITTTLDTPAYTFKDYKVTIGDADPVYKNTEDPEVSIQDGAFIYEFEMPDNSITIEVELNTESIHTFTLTNENPTYGTATSSIEGSVYSNQKITLTATPNEHYSFIGGYVAGLGIIGYATSYTYVMANKDVTVSAQFSNNMRTITYYNLEGAVNDPLNPDEYDMKEGVAEFHPATKENYLFGGWYTNSSFTGEPKTSQAANVGGDLYLFAKWIPASVSIKIGDGEYAAMTVVEEPSSGLLAEYSFSATSVAIETAVSFKAANAVVEFTFEDGSDIDTETNKLYYDANDIYLKVEYNSGVYTYTAFVQRKTTGTGSGIDIELSKLLFDESADVYVRCFNGETTLGDVQLTSLTSLSTIENTNKIQVFSMETGHGPSETEYIRYYTDRLDLVAGKYLTKIGVVGKNISCSWENA